jgi:phage protein D
VKPGRPSATITIDGKNLTSFEAGLVRLSVDMAQGTHHAAELTLWPQSKFAETAVGAQITLALGVDGEDEDVLTGEVSGASGTPSGVRLEAVSATIALSRARKSQTYVSQTVADIVNDLASDVDIDEVSADLTLSAYSVDQRRTVWAHLVELASLAGSDLGCAPSGGLRFVPPASGPGSFTFMFGATVLDWQLANLTPPPVPKIAPQGAASEQGADKWHWILHDPVGEDGDPTRIVGAFHTRDAADGLAKAIEERAARAAVRGRVRLVGESGLRPGEVIEIDDLPGPAAGPFRILSVHHTFDARYGFYTDVMVESAGGGGLPF